MRGVCSGAVRFVCSEPPLLAAGPLAGSDVRASDMICAPGARPQVRNNGDGQLNHHVGADYVQKEQKPPNGVAFPADQGRK